MFDSSKNISTRLADAADLLIDFATLGEYGFEPVGRTAPSCEVRRRQAVPSVVTSRRHRLGEPSPVALPQSSGYTRRHRIDGPFLLRP
jgi:hypothetical protein